MRRYLHTLFPKSGPLYLIVFFLVLPLLSPAQVAFWQKYFGGSGFDLGQEVIVKEDGTILVAAEAYSSDKFMEGNHSSQSDICLFQYSTQEIIFWKKFYGGSGEESISQLIETKDGGYAFIGTTGSQDGDINRPNGQLDIWVVKLDDLGNIEWAENYGGTGNDRGFAILETSDGGFLIGGESGSMNGNMLSERHNGLECWIAKLNKRGSILWERHIGGDANERIVALKEVTREEYTVVSASSSRNGDKGDAFGKKDVWVLGLDAVGNIMWQSTIGGEANDDVHDVIIDADGNLLMAGTTFSTSIHIQKQQGKGDAWLLKTTNKGEVIWSKTFGGSRADGGSKVIQTYDGGYLLCGMARSINGDVLANNGYYDGWVIKTNAFGTEIWSRTLGYEGKDMLMSVQELPEGGFIGVGFSEQLEEGTQLPGHNGNLDIWLCNFSDPKRSGVKPFITPPALEGIVYAKGSRKPLEASITLTENKTLAQLGKAQTEGDGSFVTLLPTYGLISINVLSPGYLFFGQDLRMDTLQNRRSVERNIQLEPISIGSTLILRNIYFDTGKWDLLSGSFPELERLHSFLELNPRVVIEVSGHTDNTGNKDQKVELSLNRANAVRDYLMSKGIDGDRLRVKGYGMYRPIAPNTSYSGRQKN
ncbi:MAG: OmpA family protein, partial [Bacteroidota bacterium]